MLGLTLLELARKVLVVFCLCGIILGQTPLFWFNGEKVKNRF